MFKFLLKSRTQLNLFVDLFVSKFAITICANRVTWKVMRKFNYVRWNVNWIACCSIVLFSMLYNVYANFLDSYYCLIYSFDMWYIQNATTTTTKAFMTQWIYSLQIAILIWVNRANTKTFSSHLTWMWVCVCVHVYKLYKIISTTLCSVSWLWLCVRSSEIKIILKYLLWFICHRLLNISRSKANRFFLKERRKNRLQFCMNVSASWKQQSNFQVKKTRDITKLK